MLSLGGGFPTTNPEDATADGAQGPSGADGPASSPTTSPSTTSLAGALPTVPDVDDPLGGIIDQLPVLGTSTTTTTTPGTTTTTDLLGLPLPPLPPLPLPTLPPLTLPGG